MINIWHALNFFILLCHNYFYFSVDELQMLGIFYDKIQFWRMAKKFHSERPKLSSLQFTSIYLWLVALDFVKFWQLLLCGCKLRNLVNSALLELIVWEFGKFLKDLSNNSFNPSPIEKVVQGMLNEAWLKGGCLKAPWRLWLGFASQDALEVMPSVSWWDVIFRRWRFN